MVGRMVSARQRGLSRGVFGREQLLCGWDIISPPIRLLAITVSLVNTGQWGDSDTTMVCAVVSVVATVARGGGSTGRSVVILDDLSGRLIGAVHPC